MAANHFPYRHLSDLSVKDLWIVIADKILCMGGKELPPGIQDWSKKDIIIYVIQNAGCLNS